MQSEVVKWASQIAERCKMRQSSVVVVWEIVIVAYPKAEPERPKGARQLEREDLVAARLGRR